MEEDGGGAAGGEARADACVVEEGVGVEGGVGEVWREGEEDVGGPGVVGGVVGLDVVEEPAGGEFDAVAEGVSWRERRGEGWGVGDGPEGVEGGEFFGGVGLDGGGVEVAEERAGGGGEAVEVAGGALGVGEGVPEAFGE